MLGLSQITHVVDFSVSCRVFKAAPTCWKAIKTASVGIQGLPLFDRFDFAKIITVFDLINFILICCSFTNACGPAARGDGGSGKATSPGPGPGLGPRKPIMTVYMQTYVYIYMYVFICVCKCDRFN